MICHIHLVCLCPFVFSPPQHFSSIGFSEVLVLLNFFISFWIGWEDRVRRRKGARVGFTFFTWFASEGTTWNFTWTSRKRKDEMWASRKLVCFLFWSLRGQQGQKDFDSLFDPFPTKFVSGMCTMYFVLSNWWAFSNCRNLVCIYHQRGLAIFFPGVCVCIIELCHHNSVISS